MKISRILFRLLMTALVLAGLLWARHRLDQFGSWEETLQGWVSDQVQSRRVTYSGPMSALGNSSSDSTAREGASEGFQKFLKGEMPTLGEMAQIRPEEAANMARIADQKAQAQKNRVEDEIRRMEAGY